MAATGCEPVDDGAATRAKGWDQVLTDHVVPHDRDVFTDVDETMSVADGCAKTELDAHDILKAQCASCHDQASPDQAPGTFDFVLDDAKMKAQTWTRPGGGTAMKYLSVGKPDQSAIFLRAGVTRDMPPPATGSDPYLPPVTFSGVSVLRQWIEVCMN
jgi:hypothetical protein